MAGGRPHKFTPETVSRLLMAIRAGLPYHLAAEAAGISEATFHKWQRGVFPRGVDPQMKQQFVEELTRARGESALRLIGIVTKAAPDDWRAAAWILERRFRESFGRNIVEVTGEDGGPLQVDVAAMQQVILKALDQHPDAKLAVAEALVEVDERARSA